MKNGLLGACERVVFYLFVSLIPFQIGKFIVSFGPLNNFFYNQVFIYLSDLLIVSLLCFWLVRIIKNKEKNIFYAIARGDFFLLLFLIFAGISIFMASNKAMAMIHFIKISEFVLLYFYIKNNFWRFDKRFFSYVVLSSALLQVLVSSLQFYYQESLGMRYLGESVISPIIKNVAKINEDGFRLVRAYGTFPHPNVLAAFSLFALFLPYYLFLGNRAEIRQESATCPLPYYPKIRQTLNSLLPLRVKVARLAGLVSIVSILAILIMGLFLSFSRIAIISFVFTVLTMLISLLFIKNKERIATNRLRKYLFLTAMILISCLIVFNKELFSRFSDSDSITQRIFYVDVFKNAIAHSPVFGIGVGNFVNYFYDNYPGLPEWQYQPVHNLLLLITAEIGLIGGLSFILFLGYNIYAAIRKNEYKLFEYIVLFAVACLLIVSNFDHYFWTLQQGQILFWSAMGVVSAMKKSGNKNNILSSNHHSSLAMVNQGTLLEK